MGAYRTEFDERPVVGKGNLSDHAALCVDLPRLRDSQAVRAGHGAAHVTAPERAIGRARTSVVCRGAASRQIRL